MAHLHKPRLKIPTHITVLRVRANARRRPAHARSRTDPWTREAGLLGGAAQAPCCGFTVEPFLVLIEHAWAHEVGNPAGIAPSTHPQQESVNARLARWQVASAECSRGPTARTCPGGSLSRLSMLPQPPTPLTRAPRNL